MNRLKYVVASTLLALAPAFAFAGGDFGEQAPDFPPGVFSDGGRQQVANFCSSIVTQYPDTPTAAKATEIGSAILTAPAPQ